MFDPAPTYARTTVFLAQPEKRLHLAGAPDAHRDQLGPPVGAGPDGNVCRGTILCRVPADAVGRGRCCPFAGSQLVR